MYIPKDFKDELSGYLVEIGVSDKSLMLILLANEPTLFSIISSPYVMLEFSEIFLKKSD